MAKITRSREHVVRRLEQVRALAHPLRIRLFEAFARGPKTTKQAAELLGLPPTRLYHHVNALEAVGLIRLKETRPVRGTIEKYYEAVARKMMVDANVFGEATGGLSGMLASVMDEARRDLEAALERKDTTPDTLKPVALRAIVRVDPRRGVIYGDEVVYPGPLPEGGRYVVFVEPGGDNVARQGTFQPRPHKAR